MSILLLSCRNYDDYEACYELDGPDALRAALACGHPVVKGYGVTVQVTIHHEGLTDEICHKNLEEARHELARGPLELQLPLER